LFIESDVLTGRSEVVATQPPKGEIKGLDVMLEGHVGADVALRGLEDMVHGIGDALGDFLTFRDATPIPCLGFRRLVKERVRGLVTGGAALGEDEEAGGMSPANLSADIVPEIGGDVILALDDLRGTGEVEDEASEALGRVPSEEHFDGVVLIPLDAVEVLVVGLAVHFRIAVEVCDATVVANDGMAERPTHAAGLTPIRGFDDDLGDPLD